MKEKKCIHCGETLPLSEFYRHKQMADGHLNSCKHCQKSRVRANRAKNVDRYRAYDRRRYAEDETRQIDIIARAAIRAIDRADEVREAQRRWGERNKHQRKAHNAVNNAVRDGRLHKPTCCNKCGQETPSRRLQAHHHDYDRPLNVDWVCTTCHGQTHRIGWRTCKRQE